MGVGIDQPWDEDFAGEIDHLGFGSAQRESFVVTADAFDRSIADSDGLLDGKRGINRDHFSAMENEVRLGCETIERREAACEQDEEVAKDHRVLEGHRAAEWKIKIANRFRRPSAKQPVDVTTPSEPTV
jgi:hypothetical protein